VAAQNILHFSQTAPQPQLELIPDWLENIAKLVTLLLERLIFLVMLRPAIFWRFPQPGHMAEAWLAITTICQGHQ
jgi:hypothetical protein